MWLDDHAQGFLGTNLVVGNGEFFFTPPMFFPFTSLSPLSAKISLGDSEGKGYLSRALQILCSTILNSSSHFSFNLSHRKTGDLSGGAQADATEGEKKMDEQALTQLLEQILTRTFPLASSSLNPVQ